MKRPEGFDRQPQRAQSVEEPAVVEPVTVEPAEAEPAAGESTPVGPARIRGESNAQRTDRLLRAAERRAQLEDRRRLRALRKDARRAAAAGRTVELAQVRRFTRRTRRRRNIALGVVAGLLLSFAGLVGLVNSPAMAVRNIEVVGASRIDPAAIQAALESSIGQPIATITDDGIRDDLAPFTALRSVAVDVVPPSSIVVRVVERVPMAIAIAGGEARLVDPAGVDLGPAADERLPVLEGVTVGSAPFDAAMSAIVEMPETLREQVATVTATTRDDIAMRLLDGAQVVWGGAADSGQKAAVLDALVAATESGGAVTFDVSAPEHPVVRN